MMMTMMLNDALKEADTQYYHHLPVTRSSNTIAAADDELLVAAAATKMKELSGSSVSNRVDLHHHDSNTAHLTFVKESDAEEQQERAAAEE
eukprot:c15765_g1_i1 orf=3-272(-)